MTRSPNRPVSLTGATRLDPPEPDAAPLMLWPDGDPDFPTVAGSTAWMDDAACAEPDMIGLPWLADRDETSLDDRERMAGVCLSCFARTACNTFAKAEGISGGFWSGRHRDVQPHIYYRPTRPGQAAS